MCYGRLMHTVSDPGICMGLKLTGVGSQLVFLQGSGGGRFWTGVPPCGPGPQLCFIFFDAHLSGNESGDLFGLPSAWGVQTLGTTTGGLRGPDSGSHRSLVSVLGCSEHVVFLPGWQQGQRGIATCTSGSFYLSLSSRGRSALRFLNVICERSWNSMMVFPLKIILSFLLALDIMAFFNWKLCRQYIMSLGGAVSGPVGLYKFDFSVLLSL